MNIYVEVCALKYVFSSLMLSMQSMTVQTIETIEKGRVEMEVGWLT